jgi:hypothetical protein
MENSVFSGADPAQVKEGWEKLVMSKIYDRVFGAPGTDESKSNAQLTRKMDSYRWIEERHLDLPFQFQLSLEVAQAELLRVNGFRSPRDKLVIMQNVLQLIVGKQCVLSKFRYHQEMRRRRQCVQ